jgi:WD40 repeat protein
MPDADREQRLYEVLASYLEAAEAGRAPSRAELLARHPELAGELASFLDARERLTQAVPSPAPPAEAPTLATESVSAGAPPPLDTVRYVGDYELLQEIARGGMGVVYRARQVSLNRIVALKMILAGQLASAADVQRFKAEAEAAANLDHPNIVPIYEVGDHNGQQYFSMKLIEGPSLGAVVPDLVRDPRRAAALLARVAHAVHYAHQRGILHRDLKPANVLLDKDGEPYVTDFGLAKRVEGDSRLTQSGAIVGTPSYMAPEQAAARKGLSTAADVYSLGAVLYECLTGRPPFRAATPLETLLQVLDREPERPSGVLPRVDRDLETVCLKCLEKEPAKRYESAEALARDLERWLAGEPIRARPAGAAERALKWVRRRPAVAALSAALLLIALAGVAGVVWEWRAAAANAAEARQAQGQAEQVGEALRQQRDAAVAARKAEAQARGEAEAGLYLNRINLAYQYWRGDNLRQAEDILGFTPPPRRSWEYDYLRRLCHADLLTLPGGVGQYPSELSFSKDGKRLAVVAHYGDSGARVWDLATNRPLAGVSQGLARHPVRFTCGALSPDGATLALGDHAGAVTLWDAATGKQLRPLGRLPGHVNNVAFSPDGARLVAAAAPNEGKGMPLLRFAPGEVLKAWEVASGKEVASRAGVAGAVFCPDGRHLLVHSPPGLLAGTSYHVFALWGADTWKEVRNLGQARSYSFSGDGGRLALAGWDNNVPFLRVLETAGGKVVFSVSLPAEAGDVALSPDGQTLAAVGGGRPVIDLWDVKERRLLRRLRGHLDRVTALAFTPDGRRLVSCSWDNAVKFWDVRADQEAHALPAPPRPALLYGSDVALSPDRTRAAWAQGDQVGGLFGARATVTLTEVATGRVLRVLSGHSDGARRVTFSADGRRVASGGRDAAVHVWEADTGRHVTAYKGHQGYVECLAFSPDGRLMASADEGQEMQQRIDPRAGYAPKPGTAHVWDARTGQEVRALAGHQGKVTGVAFSPDGRLLASASFSTAILWDTATWRELRRLEGYSGEASELVFSTDGTLLATLGNASATVWDVASGKWRHVLHGHSLAQPGGAAFSADGRRLATAVGREVKLWDVDSGQEVLSLPLLDSEPGRGFIGVGRLAFSPDGRRLLAALRDGSVQYWDATPLPAAGK